MNNYIFLFSLDAVLLKKTIFGALAEKYGCAETDHRVNEELPYDEYMKIQIGKYGHIPVSELQNVIADMERNNLLIDFIKRNRDCSYIVTGHLDTWIKKLISEIGMSDKLFCSGVSEDGSYNFMNRNTVINSFSKPIIAVGNDNADAEMIEAAECGIAFGNVSDIALSVLASSTHAIFQEERLVSFLEQLQKEDDNEDAFSRSVVISCAGMGNRLGLGTTKALIDVDGQSLILRHLHFLDDEKDVRIVVGYQAERVINEVIQYRKDILFVFNHDYRNTGTGASVALAAKYSNRYILSLDGDMLIHPDDMKKILRCHTEFVGGNMIESEEPWMLQTYDEDGKKMVRAFSKTEGDYEWNGIMQMKTSKIVLGKWHVFHLIEPNLPLEFKELQTREIDTIGDYDKAVLWVKNKFC